MTLSDILDAEVLGPDGARRGFVVDARFELEVTEHWSSDEAGTRAEEEADAVGAATLVGLLVSPRTGGSFLGYERSEVRSPWPIAQWVRWRHRGTFLVPWEDVADVGPHTVRLAEGYRELNPRLP